MLNKILVLSITIVSFLSTSDFSHAFYNRSTHNYEIMGTDIYKDEETKRQIHQHNARVVQNRIETANKFWEFVSFVKYAICNAVCRF